VSYARRPMGDYKTYGYAGDPGFLSSLWKGVKSFALPIIGGALGGPAGAAIGKAMVAGGGKPGKQLTVPGTFSGSVGFPGGMSISGGYVPGDIIPGQGRLPPYTATGAGVLPMGGRGGVCLPSGYHWAKDGSGRVVRNRRMNVANPKALRRAMRRAQGFEKLARRSINFNKRIRPASKRKT